MIAAWKLFERCVHKPTVNIHLCRKCSHLVTWLSLCFTRTYTILISSESYRPLHSFQIFRCFWLIISDEDSVSDTVSSSTGGIGRSIDSTGARTAAIDPVFSHRQSNASLSKDEHLWKKAGTYNSSSRDTNTDTLHNYHLTRTDRMPLTRSQASNVTSTVSYGSRRPVITHSYPGHAVDCRQMSPTSSSRRNEDRTSRRSPTYTFQSQTAGRYSSGDVMPTVSRAKRSPESGRPTHNSDDRTSSYLRDPNRASAISDYTASDRWAASSSVNRSERYLTRSLSVSDRDIATQRILDKAQFPRPLPPSPRSSPPRGKAVDVHHRQRK